MSNRIDKRIIRLELLRHGSMHGQLLSTATPYLALCENHAAQSFQVPLDHVDHLDRIDGLRYQADAMIARDTALRAATSDVSQILAEIPALTAELAACASGDIVHLRLILSAAELASLPFELAEAPPGTPIEGQSLLLNASRRVILTREARRIAPAPVPWPYRPRVLFAFATPRGLPPVPADAHLLALRRALDPWIGWTPEVLAEIQTHLTVLPNATLRSIKDACEKACRDEHGPYTHVHLLVHGIERPAPGSRERRFYLALHADGGSDESDPVDGRRLEMALRSKIGSRDRLAVVTIAGCDAGNIGSPLAGGASSAHELHEAGVPFVVASQFPLSFRGSVIMVDRLYQELLRGTDPVLAMHEVRRALYAEESYSAHDWASLVTYAALPPDIDAQVARARYHRTRKAGDVALARIRRLPYPEGSVAQPGDRRPLASLRDALDQAVKEMDEIAREVSALTARARGWLASVAVRWAETMLEAEGATQAETDTARGEEPEPALSTMTPAEALWMAERAFDEAFMRDGSLTWALVQRLSIRWVRSRELDPEVWAAAMWLCSQDLRGPARQRKLLAHDNLAQLRLLSLALPPGHPGRSDADVGALVKYQLKKVLEFGGVRSYAAFTVRRQMRRHATWWKSFRETNDAAREIARIGSEMDEWLKGLGVPTQWHER